MKKFVLTALACILIATTLVACSAKNDIPYGKPSGWDVYAETLASDVSDMICGKDDVTIRMDGSLTIAGTRYPFSFGTDYSLSSPDDSAMSATISAANSAIFSLKSNNECTYIDISQNSVLSSAKIKLEQTNFFDWLNVEYNTANKDEAKETVKEFVTGLCTEYFKNADTTPDKKALTFVLADGVKGEKLTALSQMISFIDEEVATMFAGALGISDVNALVSTIPEIAGSLTFAFDNGVLSISSTNLTIGSKECALVVKVTTSDTDKIKDSFPTSDDGYKVTKIACSSIDGTLASMDSATKRIAVKYDMQLNANVDVMKLLFNDYDLNCLDDDNFLHLRLSHKCTADCSEYCKSRISPSKGAVIDIAFSPSAFGSHNLYINVNVKCLMSDDYLEKISKYDNTVNTLNIPDYCMFTLVPEELGKDVSKLLLKWYSSIMADESGKVDFDFAQVKEIFSKNAIANRILSDIDSDEFDIDTLRVKIDDNIYGQVNEYDIYKDVVYIIDKEESSLKSYAAAYIAGCKEYNSLSWSYETDAEAKDTDGSVYTLTNVYDEQGNLIHGANGGKYVPMSATEAQSLVGKSLKYSYVNLEKTTVENVYATIVSISDIDFSSTDLQEVKARVTRPSALDYDWGLGEVRAHVLRRFFKCQGDECTQEVTLKIKLEEEIPSSFLLETSPSDAEYKITSSTQIPQFIVGNATIKYRNGAEKSISAIGQSDAVTTSTGLFSTSYHVVNWGRVSVRYNVGGRQITRYVNIRKPDEFEFVTRAYSAAIDEPCYITNYATLRAVYKDTVDGIEKKTSVTIRLSLADFYIDGTSLANDSTAWGHHAGYDGSILVFYKSNDYTVTVKKNGFVSDPFKITITPKEYTESQYKFTASGDVQSIYYQNAEFALNGSITNAVHGDGEDKNHTVKISVYEGKMQNGTMNFSQKADENDFDLAWSIGNTTASGDTLDYPLPTMIKNAISLKTRFTFKKQGYFRITISIDGTNVYQTTVTIV